MAAFQAADGSVHAAQVSLQNGKLEPATVTGVLFLITPGVLTTPVNTPVVVSATVPAGTVVGGVVTPGIGSMNFTGIVMPLLSSGTTLTLNTSLALYATGTQPSSFTPGAPIGGAPLVVFTSTQAVQVNFTPAVTWGDITWS